MTDTRQFWHNGDRWIVHNLGRSHSSLTARPFGGSLPRADIHAVYLERAKDGAFFDASITGESVASVSDLQLQQVASGLELGPLTRIRPQWSRSTDCNGTHLSVGLWWVGGLPAGHEAQILNNNGRWRIRHIVNGNWGAPSGDYDDWTDALAALAADVP